MISSNEDTCSRYLCDDWDARVWVKWLYVSNEVSVYGICAYLMVTWEERIMYSSWIYWWGGRMRNLNNQLKVTDSGTQTKVWTIKRKSSHIVTQQIKNGGFVWYYNNKIKRMLGRCCVGWEFLWNKVLVNVVINGMRRESLQGV